MHVKIDNLSKFIRKNATPRFFRRSCFTLMEVMVATMILGMITTVIYASFAQTLEIPGQLREIHERYHKIRMAMNRICREVSMAYLSKHINPNQDESPNYIFRIKENSPGDRLDFTSFANWRRYENTPVSDQCEIGYFLQEDPEVRDRINLVRRQQDFIDHEPGWGGVVEVLCEDVVDFQVYAWKEEEEEWGEEWDSSQLEQSNTLPKIIRIELTIQDDEGERTTFYTKAQVMLNKPIDFNSL